MSLALTGIWPQPLDPLHSIALSALVAALPLILVLVLMGGLRKSGLFASVCGLAAAGLLAMLVWHMPLALVLWSAAYGFIYALWPVLWIVFGGLWLYNLTQDTGKFELLRRWMEEHASGDACIQAILVAFCFGALLEGSAGFGAPVAVTACLLVGLGFEPRQAVIVALIAATCFGTPWQPAIRSRRTWRREMPLHFRKYSQSYLSLSRLRSIDGCVQVTLRNSPRQSEPKLPDYR